MAKLIYSMLMSLDGYIADEAGNFDWAEPDEEVHRFVKRPRTADRHLPHRYHHLVAIAPAAAVRMSQAMDIGLPPRRRRGRAP